MYESKEEKCWDGYKKVGTKNGTGKNKNKKVNNCVKIKEIKMKTITQLLDEIKIELSTGKSEADFNKKVQLSFSTSADPRSYNFRSINVMLGEPQNSGKGLMIHTDALKKLIAQFKPIVQKLIGDSGAVANIEQSSKLSLVITGKTIDEVVNGINIFIKRIEALGFKFLKKDGIYRKKGMLSIDQIEKELESI